MIDLDAAFRQQLFGVAVGEHLAKNTSAQAIMITSGGNRNPVKLDPGAGGRERLRRLNTACRAPHRWTLYYVALLVGQICPVVVARILGEVVPHQRTRPATGVVVHHRAATPGTGKTHFSCWWMGLTIVPFPAARLAPSPHLPSSSGPANSRGQGRFSPMATLKVFFAGI